MPVRPSVVAPETYISVSAVEDVEGAVVVGGPEVVDVVFHFHLDAVTLVVLATLELLVAVLLGKSLEVK